MNKSHFLLVAAGLMLAAETSAQRYRRYRPPMNEVRRDTMVIVNAYVDSLLNFRQKQDSAMAERISHANTTDARLFRLFAPLTFYHSPACRWLDVSVRPEDGDTVVNAVDDALMCIYMKRPDLVKATERQLKKSGTIRDDFDKPIKSSTKIAETVDPLPDEPAIVPTGVMLRRPNFWTFYGDSYLQFLQNYVSENWYKGGESNYSMVGSLTLNANYNNKKGLKIENKLEMKLGFQTSPSDTLHKFKTNNDLIRYTGRMGLQASKRWYYTLQLLAYTQFTQGLRSNDEKVYSDFMSPFNFNLGLGMTYSLSAFGNKLSGNVNLSPLSFNFRYVDRRNLASRYGISGDHRTLEDFGSQLTAEATWTFSSQVKWKTRLYGYTTYERTEIEWENTLTLSFSKYISTNIFVYPRFDDSTSRDEHLGYWQFKEYCSLGFNYSF